MIAMRHSGILMHLTSLPSPHGVGTMGQAARDFVDFLQRAGQDSWQILPICPTSYGDSPYQSFSAYAGNPYLIDLDDLVAEGLLVPEEYQNLEWGEDPTQVDFGLLYQRRFPVLRHAVRRLLVRDAAGVEDFAQGNPWLEDYALFMALKDRHGGVAWSQWPEGERRRDPETLAQARQALADELDFWRGVQFLFFRQWRTLKTYANDRGISLIGDMPIYVAGDSADVWADPLQFQLDDDLLPTEVAGCPPDGFSADGQLWGNPLFHWERMEQEDFRWWTARIDYQCGIYDVLRIDHFRGFDAYYAIPFGDVNARRGRWREGPGIRLFQTVERAIGPRAIIAEDLGFLTDSVRQMLTESGYPGMKVLQFAFDSRDGGGYLPHSFPRHCVAYIGTHDNDTILGWMAAAPAADVEKAKSYLRLNREEGYVWGMLRALWASPADLAVVQMQDLLELGHEARMNTPSTVGLNWKWRCLPGAYSEELADRVRREMELYARLPN